MIETGVVEWFDARVKKRFGRLKLESGEEIFFHYNYGQFLLVGSKAPEFSGKPTMVISGKTIRLRAPKPGEVLVFQRSNGSKGAIASPWGFNSQWKAIEEAIANRPVYRVLETMNALSDQPGEPKELWQGSDLSELLRKFPVPHGRQSPGADPLLPYYSDTDCIFEVRHWWEMKISDCSWEQCNDPRPLSGVLRQFEAINRHAR